MGLASFLFGNLNDCFVGHWKHFRVSGSLNMVVLGGEHTELVTQPRSLAWESYACHSTTIYEIKELVQIESRLRRRICI